MSKQKENIIFRKEWRDALKGVSAEIRAEVYEAILTYSFDGEVIEMSDVAKMAFTFIKTHIDNINNAYQATCEKRKQSAQQRWNNANECEPMQTNANDANAYFASKNDANECEPMQTDAKRCKAMHNNNDIDNDITLSLSISLSSSTDEEFDEEKNSGLTSAERERILEVFHLERNLISAKEESEKFINYYEANGWRRGNSTRQVKNKAALARSWKVEREEKRYPEELREWMHQVYQTLRKNKRDASFLLGMDYHKIDDGYALIIAEREQATQIEMIASVLERKFNKIIYRIRKH